MNGAGYARIERPHDPPDFDGLRWFFDNCPRNGLLDGAGTNALFNQPRGLVLDGSGNIYVADSGNAAIRKISVNATVSTPAMTQGSTTGYTSSIPKGQVGGGTDSSSGGGGGGGAVNPWFAGLLALLGISRWFTRKR